MTVVYLISSNTFCMFVLILSSRGSGGSRGGARPRFLFLDQTEARRAKKKKFFGDRPFPLSKGLDDLPSAPSPYLKV